MKARHNGVPVGGSPATTADVAAAEAAAKAYADSIVAGGFKDRGNYDASTNVFPSTGGSGTAGAIKKGDAWMISVAGTLGGVAVEAGDMLRATADTPGQTASNWVITERNLGYIPENASMKDASGGYAGLTLFKLNLRNVADTFTSFLTNTATAARTWAMQDRSGTVALTTEESTSISSSGGVITLDASGPKRRHLVMTENVTSVTVTNPPAAGTFVDIEILTEQHASAAKTFSNPATAGTVGGAWTISAVLSSKQPVIYRIFSDSSIMLIPLPVVG